MNRRADRRDVNQAVERLPAAAQTPNPPLRGRDRERDQQNERCESHQDERTLRDVADNGAPVEELIEHDVRREMKRSVEERKEPEHAAVLDDGVPSRQPADRSDSQCEHQELQRPATGLQLDRFSGIRAQRPLKDPPYKPRDRKERRKEGQRFDDAAHVGASRISSDPYPSTSSPLVLRTR